MNNTFDFVIVGAGSAGCVLANRLSENGKFSVCLLESGPKDKTMMAKIPGAFSYFMFSKKYSWHYQAKSDPNIRDGEPLFVPRGKTLGGSSSTNAMLYIRGQHQDYDGWAALGNNGWSYKELLPYFKKSETNELGKTEYHGDSGPLQVTTRPQYYPFSSTFIDASIEAGFKFNKDFNGEDQEGVGYYQCTIKDGERSSASKAYLTSSLNRSNLTIITEAFADKITFKNKQAHSVLCKVKGKPTEFIARKELIVSSGAINSPKLLLLSGIGDEKQLSKHNIETVKHLPGVGENLQEHVDACVLVENKQKNGFTMSASGLLKMLPDTINYFKNKTGKLSNSIVETGAFLRSSDSVDRPDIQLHVLPLLYDDNGRDFKLMSKHGLSCHVCVLRPKSRGSVSLASTDPKMPPTIDFNFFSHPDDKKVLVDGIKQARKIFNANSLSHYCGEEIHPGVNAQTDDEIFEKSLQRLGTVFHPVGTCKMGNDDLAVVDQDLKVHGVENLRVIDASIMPTLISGNTNAPTIAIAEKASDSILAEYSS